MGKGRRVNDDFLRRRFSIPKPDPEPREVLHLVGLEDAVLGVAYRAGRPGVIAYDYDACIEGLMQMGMSPDNALQMVEDSMQAVMGPETPVVVKRMPFEDALDTLELEAE